MIIPNMFTSTDVRKPRRPVAYVAGPYTADERLKREKNILEAEEIAKRLFLLGYAVICPHMNTARWDDDPRFSDRYQDFLEACTELVTRVDVVVALNGWRSSPGAQQEIAEAVSRGIPVLYKGLAEAEEWIRAWKEVNQAA